MKRVFWIMACLTAACFSSCDSRQENGEPQWIDNTLSAIEDYRLSLGDSVSLSRPYVARIALVESAKQCFLSQGSERVTLEGSPQKVIDIILRQGLAPSHSYPGREQTNYQTLCRKVNRLVEQSLSRHERMETCMEKVDDLLNQEMGYMPHHIFLYGAEYTVLEFAHSVYHQGDTIKLNE